MLQNYNCAAKLLADGTNATTQSDMSAVEIAGWAYTRQNYATHWTELQYSHRFQTPKPQYSWITKKETHKGQQLYMDKGTAQ